MNELPAAHRSPATVIGGIVAPVVPRDEARLALTSLSNTDMTIGAGFWADRLTVNRETSLICGAEELEKAGNFANFRVAAGLETGSYRGYSAIGVPWMFLDSDVYKWLEAVYWELGRAHSPRLQALADDAVRLLAAAQEPDGYLNSFFQITTPGRRWHTLVVGHELYNAGHLVQAGVAEIRATGQRALFDVVLRNVDCIYAEFITRGNPGLPAHPVMEMGLVELYRVTGDPRHLELANAFIDRRGHSRLGEGRWGPVYYQDHLPIRQATEITGHAVMALYLASGLVDSYVETGDEDLLRTAERQWDDLVATKMYLTGGFGSRYRDEAIGDAYELPADRAYCETCAAIGSIQLSWRLLLVTGDGKYADLIERTLYNAMLPGVSLDGRTFFYANPLHVRSAHADPADRIGAAERSPWFFCACCPPNVMRTLSSFEHLIATRSGSDVQVHQFVPGTIAHGETRLQVATGYPWAGGISITVEGAPVEPFELAIRIPGWAEAGATLDVNGMPTPAVADALGYWRLKRRWRAGDTVVLGLPMAPRWLIADERIDSVRGCVALERGPLVYCFEHVDQEDGVSLDKVNVSAEPPGETTAAGLDGVVALRASGHVHAHDNRKWPYRPSGEEGGGPGRETTLVAIPYFAWANRTRGAMRIWIPEQRGHRK